MGGWWSHSPRRCLSHRPYLSSVPPLAPALPVYWCCTLLRCLPVQHRRRLHAASTRLSMVRRHTRGTAKARPFSSSVFPSLFSRSAKPRVPPCVNTPHQRHQQSGAAILRSSICASRCWRETTRSAASLPIPACRSAVRACGARCSRASPRPTAAAAAQAEAAQQMWTCHRCCCQTGCLPWASLRQSTVPRFSMMHRLRRTRLLHHLSPW